MSKFERYSKTKSETYIFPHKHCKRCSTMIDDSISYCPECYELLKQKKEKKRFNFKKKKKDQKD
ncbi:MAG: hypothetical protein GY870_18015 [archaeon]|nr:hypothetical protein [archaeon]